MMHGGPITDGTDQPRLNGEVKDKYFFDRLYGYPFPWFKFTMYFLMMDFCFSRMYLLVECLVSVAFATPAVFDVPNVATYFPHIV